MRLLSQIFFYLTILRILDVRALTTPELATEFNDLVGALKRCTPCDSVFQTMVVNLPVVTTKEVYSRCRGLLRANMLGRMAGSREWNITQSGRDYLACLTHLICSPPPEDLQVLRRLGEV